MLLSLNQSINIVYPQWELHISLCLSQKETRVFPQTKFVLFIPNKQRVEMVFSQNQRINIVYPNGNYLFFHVHRKKKIDSTVNEIRLVDS